MPTEKKVTLYFLTKNKTKYPPPPLNRGAEAQRRRGGLCLCLLSRGGRGGVSWPHMGRLSAGRWAVMCVGGPGSELAGWVPHVRALCFDGSDTFEGNKCFFLSP